MSFFQHMKQNLQRDYILIVDKSGSMAGSRWNEAKLAVSMIAPSACQADPDGITLYFFSSPGQTKKYTNIKTAQQVVSSFERERPSGNTDLAGVLNTAFSEHFSRPGAQTTILVITDGEPNNKNAAVKEIVNAANRLTRDEDLSVSFIQVGNDSSATKFLKSLDDDIQARFDIVDTISADMIKFTQKRNYNVQLRNLFPFSFQPVSALQMNKQRSTTAASTRFVLPPLWSYAMAAMIGKGR